MQLLQDFPSMFIIRVTVAELVLGLLTAFVCGALIGIIYRITAPRGRNTSTRSRPLVVFTMVTAVMIMVIGNNLARALGLVGAVSVVRFRMAVKDIRDIVYIFFALAAGLASGIGAQVLAVAGSVFIAVILLVLSFSGFGANPNRKHLLECRVMSETGEAALVDVIERFTTAADPARIKASGISGGTEVAYRLTLMHPAAARDLVTELEHIPDISHINLFIEDR